MVIMASGIARGRVRTTTTTTATTTVESRKMAALLQIRTLRSSTTVDYDGWMSVTQRRTPVGGHRRTSGTVCFPAVSRRVEDGRTR